MTTKRSLRFAIGFVATASTVLAPRVADASPSDTGHETPSQRADRLFDESKALLAAGSYAEACPKLAESQSLDPATGTLLALALCHEAEGKTASATTELRQVSDAATREHRADRVKLAGEHLAHLAPLLSWIVVTVPAEVAATDGLTIERDGRAVPPTEWNQRSSADPGEHVVSASAPGRTVWRAAFVLPKQETKTLAIPKLEEVPQAKDEAPRVAFAPETRSPRTAGFITLGVGGALLALGTAFGVAALVESHDATSLCPGGTCPAGSMGPAKSQTAHTDAWVADVGLGAGLVAVGIGVYLTVRAPKQTSLALRIVPELSRDRAGLGLGASW